MIKIRGELKNLELKKINLSMTWLNVIIFALITGIYTGLVMLVPFLDGTSFQDIGISYECWVVFAVIVVLGCKKSWEAALKCFVFFLISQPLVYLVEILFGSLTFELAGRYYLNFWLPMTFLTLPGGFIAWFCKKQNMFGAVVLGMGNAIEFIMGAYYLKCAITAFPYHLLTAIFCFASAVVMTLIIQKSKKNRIISLVIPAVIVVVLIILARVLHLTFI